MVRAFDSLKVHSLEKEPCIEFGPWQFEVPLIVVDIPATLNMLLGLPWIHIAGTILSSLHHKLKFIKGDMLIKIMVEKEIQTLSSVIRFINTQDVREDNKYHAFKFVPIGFIPQGEKFRGQIKTEFMELVK